MPDPLRHVRVLAGEIGPRSATSVAEAQAARYIAEAASDYTHQVWLEPFRSYWNPIHPWILLVLIGVVGGLLSWTAPGAGASLSALAAVLAGGQAAGWLDLGALLPEGPSQNVVSVVPARDSLQQRVVIVAHYDSPSGWGSVGSAALAGGLAAVAGLAVLTATGNLPGPPYLALLATALLVALTAWLVRAAGRAGPSHAESASGVAVALEAGKLLARAPLQHTEVWLVYTGSREPGSTGLRRLLERHGPMLADSAFLVLDRTQAALLSERGWKVTAEPVAALPPDHAVRTLVSLVRAEANEAAYEMQA